MAEKYIISIDQSTQGTKALLFDEGGSLIKRTDKPHEQIVNEKGWVSHNPVEIYENVIDVVARLTKDIDGSGIIGVGISNQRETSLAWDRITGEPLADAIVWQCARAANICERVEKQGEAENIRRKTGMNLSPYFPASKIAWLLENVEGAREKADRGEICHGTIDSWLVYKLTGGKSYKTDYSNASRTQLFNIFELKWDEEICAWFGIDPANMARVCDSDSEFGETDFEGVLPKKVPIHGVLGDSHGSLFGQGCLKPGMTKSTYGTGSSIMMNIGEKPVLSTHGVVTSLAWSMGGKVKLPPELADLLRSDLERAIYEAALHRDDDLIARRCIIEKSAQVDVAAELGWDRSTVSRHLSYIMDEVKRSASRIAQKEGVGN